MSHAAGARRNTATSINAVEEPLSPWHLSGFGHWLPEPEPADLGRVTRPRPEVMAKLAHLVRGGYDWPKPLVPWTPAQPTVEPDDNPDIPAGYTYLMQFVAHDVVQTLTSFWAAEPAIGSANMRAAPLQLMTLYGGTPIATPIAYAPTGTDDALRTKLQIGRIGGPASTGCPFRDLARAALDEQASPEGKGLNACQMYDPLVADQRNDDNAIINQLTMLFIALHNAIVDQIAAHGRFASLPDLARNQEIFAAARLVVQRIYHAVIRHDLLKRLLHPAVHAAYTSGAEPIWSGHGGIPLEFTHGAMRAGHAMVRSVYFLLEGPQREVSLLQSLTVPRAVPQMSFWALRWSRFFDLGNGVTPNYSRRIGPGVSSLFYDHAEFPPIDDRPGAGSLPYRDLKSAFFAGLSSVSALIRTIRRMRPGLIADDWMFADPLVRASHLSDWLTKRNTRQSAGLTRDEIAAVAHDMPLPLFVMLEAALDPATEGRRLGVLGSIVIGDVLFRLLNKVAPVTDAMITPSLPPAIAREVLAVTDMPGCVRLVDRLAFGPGANPPFI